MFKYNELSDLLNGELVVPIKKEGENIICITQNNEEAIYTFDDFDFEKTVEERNFIVEDDSSDDKEEEKTQEEKEKEPITTTRKEELNNLLNITIKNWSNRTINLIGDISLPPIDETTIDVFENSPIHEQLKNLAKKMLISLTINSSKEEIEIIPGKTYTPKDDPHFASENDKGAIVSSLGYKFKNIRKVNVWTEEII